MGTVRGVLCFLICLCSGLLCAQSQVGLVAWYSFDACDATEDRGSGADGVISGNPGCGCGVVGNALTFNGMSDYIQFLGNFDILFSDDFTLSFYMRPVGSSGIVDIISKRETCTPDSSISIRLEPSSGALRAELSEGITDRFESRLNLNMDQCWHHVAWVRQGRNLLMYYDAVLVDVVSLDSDIDASNNGVFSIANSPCLMSGELRFRGALDELRLYNRSLSAGEIEELYLEIDMISTRDTIIFLGSSLQIDLPRSCANFFSWTPVQNVVQPNDREPVISPSLTTTYQVEMDYGTCFATDTIRIVVVDSTQLNCESIFLPNAFTPNNDGINDTYGLSNSFFVGDFISLQIYDRWGSLLFESFNPADEWDGVYEGEDLMPAMFIYKLRYRCDGEERFKAGSFTLIR